MIPHASTIAFLDSLGGSELIVILVVVLIFFGAEKMPEFARGLGKAIREFKKAAGDVEQEFKRAMDEAPEKPSTAAYKAPAVHVAPPPAATPPAPPPRFGDSAPGTGEPPMDHGIDA
jgi:sec-independent protein translocase protein TatA